MDYGIVIDFKFLCSKTSGVPDMEVQPKDTSKGHFYVSLVKSSIRILGGALLFFGNFAEAGICLIVAELLGIVEEIV